MEEANRSPKSILTSFKGDAVHQPAPNKIDLVVHLVSNLEKPICLTGSNGTLQEIENKFRGDSIVFHAVSFLTADSKTGDAQILGLSLHQLGITEQEVLGNRPEELLKQRLASIERVGSFLLVVIRSAHLIDEENLDRIIEFTSRHKALRVLFLLDEGKEVGWGDEQIVRYSLDSAISCGSESNDSNLQKLPAIGMVVGAILAFSAFMVPFLSDDEVDSVEKVPPSTELDKKEPKANNLAITQTPELGPPLTVESLLEKKVDEGLKYEREIAIVKMKEVPEVAGIDHLNEESDGLLALSPPAAEVKKKPDPVNEELPLAKKEERLETNETLENEASKFLTDNQHKLEKVRSEFNSDSWLLEQNPEAFMLQVMGGSDEDSIIRYLKKQENQERFAWYQTIKKGKNWYPLLYGLYPTKEAARAAVSGLPGPLKKLKPWPRDIKTIQQEIRKTKAK